MSAHITEEGSSSNANGIIDWVLNIEAMFARSKQQSSIGGLISVPDHLRKLDEQAFTPVLISIGPIHHYNAKLQTMKKLKVRICERYIERANVELMNLVESITAREKEIRSYYAETVVSNIRSVDFVTMILVDGMFIIASFLISRYRMFNDDRTIRIPDWMIPVLKSDLVLLENQLPFFVLEMLFQQVAESKLREYISGSELLSLSELALIFFEEYNVLRLDFWTFNANIKHLTTFKDVNVNIECSTILTDFNVNVEHLTDLVRFFYLNKREDVNLNERKLHGGAKVKKYTATQLHEAGVTFKVAEECDRCLYDMTFELNNGVMEISCITLNDVNIRLIRNIIALEQSSYVWHPFVTDFFVMLDFLIDNSKDVDLLCDKGILVNYLGDSNDAAAVVNNLCTNNLWVNRNPKYTKICENLNMFYNAAWRKWMAILWRQYFSTPWRAASTSAAILLLLFTVIQTVCSLKSTKW